MAENSNAVSRRGSDLSGRPSKIRRTTQACIQCRSRKQRCVKLESDDLLRACQRCDQLRISCSLTATLPEEESENAVVASTVQRVRRIQQQTLENQRRIVQLEQVIHHIAPGAFEQRHDEYARNGGSDVDSPSQQNGNVPGIEQTTRTTVHPSQDTPNQLASPNSSSVMGRSDFSMDAVNLDTPITTLRNLSSLSKNHGHNLSYPAKDQHVAASGASTEGVVRLIRPVKQHVECSDQDHHAFNIFLTHCHNHAPFLDIISHRSLEDIRDSSISLFYAVTAIGRRFMPFGSSVSSEDFCSQYETAVAQLDKHIGRLLLEPKPKDATMDNIQALLLYMQWMPLEQSSSGSYRSRYNDLSAWSVVGLIIRYTQFAGLDRNAVAPFLPSSSRAPEKQDLAKLRVWINLLTCDCHLMLSSGLPTALDPEPAAKIARDFASHPLAVQPNDSRLAAISELVCIVKTASDGSPSIRKLDENRLHKLNAGLDQWEAYWTTRLPSELNHCQMPFTTLRWYRLAANSSYLKPLLSTAEPFQRQVLPISILQALEKSVLAASQMIFVFSAQNTRESWLAQSASVASFPAEMMTVDMAKINAFRFSVDIAWITHSFAAVFLVLCYARGAIDDDLLIVRLAPSSAELTVSPQPPRPRSLLYRLISLASEIFDAVCTISSTPDHADKPSNFHAAAEYRRIIQTVFSAVLKDNNAVNQPSDLSFLHQPPTENDINQVISGSDLTGIAATMDNYADGLNAIEFDIQALVDSMLYPDWKWN